MPLVSTKPMLAVARAGGYAVGAFNILDFNSARAVVQAAVDLRAPAIVQTSVKTVEFWGARTVACWLRELAENAPVPVALHLDHCDDLATITSCAKAGWTSVMIDASDRPFEENLKLTRTVLDRMRAFGAGVEAELGAIGGVEDDKTVSDADANLVNVDQALAFCDLPLAVFAPAIGTAHGVYRHEPTIAFDRLEALGKRTAMPLALHGGTGLPEETIRRCIDLGCAKVNVSTQLKVAFCEGFVQARHGQVDWEPLDRLRAQFERIHAEVGHWIRRLGSARRSGDIHLERTSGSMCGGRS